MTISSDGEQIVKDLQRSTKITQVAERGAERRMYEYKMPLPAEMTIWEAPAEREKPNAGLLLLALVRALFNLPEREEEGIEGGKVAVQKKPGPEVHRPRLIFEPSTRHQA
jgi:hypothetical protein